MTRRKSLRKKLKDGMDYPSDEEEEKVAETGVNLDHEFFTWSNHDGYESSGNDEDEYELTIQNNPFQVELLTTSYRLGYVSDSDTEYPIFNGERELYKKNIKKFNDKSKIDDIISYIESYTKNDDERGRSIRFLNLLKEEYDNQDEEEKVIE